MDRINLGNDARTNVAQRNTGLQRDTQAEDVRALAELELMLVGGGDGGQDWGG